MFPPLYVILDHGLIWTSPEDCAKSLMSSGVELFQYRAKHASGRECFETCVRLVSLLSASQARLIVNDRSDIAALVGARGVHVGQNDLMPDDARRICGSALWVGVSTHTLDQICAANLSSADYIAVGPIFATSTKLNPDAVVGLSFISEARRLTRKPIVAIGGITLARAAEVYAAGADSLAVVSDILSASVPAARAREFLDVAADCMQKRNSRTTLMS